MAIKQALAVKTMEAAAGGKVVSASMSEVTNGWVALVIKAADKKLVCVTQGECPLTAMWAVENSCEQDGLHVDIMSLNANKRQALKVRVSVSVTGWELQADALRRCLLKSR